MSNYPANIEMMRDELTQLRNKINTLFDFVKTDKFRDELSSTQKHLMYEQNSAMDRYAEILDARIVLEERLHDAS